MKQFFALSVLAFFAFGVVEPASAIPSGGDDTTPAVKKESPKKLKCKRGQTAKKVTKDGQTKQICVKLKTEVLEDEELYQFARVLAEEGEYEWALDHLTVIRNQEDPKVLSYMGYTNRKAGRFEAGIGYYQRALALKPDFVEAREYLGEAYVISGMKDKALEQLEAIRAVCGETCEAYVELKGFIETGAAKKSDGW